MALEENHGDERSHAFLVVSSVASADEKVLGQIKETYRLENAELVVDTIRETPAGTITARHAHRKQ